MNELDDARARARVAEARLTSLVATLRRFCAEEHARDEDGDPTGVWYLLGDLEEVLGAQLHDHDEPSRWVGPPGPQEAVNPAGDEPRRWRGEPLQTSGGVPPTDELVQRLADEAERGYDVEWLRRRRDSSP